MSYLKKIDFRWSHAISYSKLARVLSQCRGFNFDLIISSTNLTISDHGANSSEETLAVFYSTNSLDWVLKERRGRGR